MNVDKQFETMSVVYARENMYYVVEQYNRAADIL